VPEGAGCIEYVAGGREPPLGTTRRVKVDPSIEPEKCAGGGGLADAGPTSIAYVPSTSNVPSARMLGPGNCPCPQPTARSHPEAVTDKHAPLPVHRPAASAVTRGSVGVPRQAARQHSANRQNWRTRSRAIIYCNIARVRRGPGRHGRKVLRAVGIHLLLCVDVHGERLGGRGKIERDSVN